jgi:hypothetical protein
MQVPRDLFSGYGSDDVETNIQIIAAPIGGLTLRRAQFEAGSEHDDLAQTVCSFLRRQHGILAVPAPGSANELLTESQCRLPRTISLGESCATLFDAGGTQLLDCARDADQAVLADFVEKAIVRDFEAERRFWRIFESARFWYSDSPQTVVDGIEVIPRLSFSVIGLPDARLGVAIDIGSLFRSEMSVADFFDSTVHLVEQERRQRRFHKLRGRGEGRKGTLLYDTGQSMVTSCYFDRFATGKTCATVPGFGGAGTLLDYCQKKYPNKAISRNDPVAYVRFKGFRRSVPVPARWLRMRISLGRDQTPREIRQAVAASPTMRKQASLHLWADIADRVLDSIGFRNARSIWKPLPHEREQLTCPALLFGQGRMVLPPQRNTREEYARYFRQRSEMLRDGGIFRFEPSKSRTIHVVTPSSDDALERYFTKDLQQRLCDYTRLPFQIQGVKADTPELAIEKLRVITPGTALIVFDPKSTDQAAYSLLSYELRGWAIKRIQRQTIESRWGDIQARRRGERRWETMMSLSALDLLDQMDSTPWLVDGFGYDGCLAIDVGQERRHFALSLLVCRDLSCDTPFLRLTRHWLKADHQHESINHVVLAKSIEDLVASIPGRPFTPLKSLLVLRDGHECGQEPVGLANGLDAWKRAGLLQQSAIIDLVDVHKHSMRGIRQWRSDGNGAINVLEGHAVYPNSRVAYVCCTGAATLSDGMTADPCVLVARNNADVRRAANAFFSLAQLNFSTPNTAHRLAQPLREVDAVLVDCQMRNMRGVK